MSAPYANIRGISQIPHTMAGLERSVVNLNEGRLGGYKFFRIILNKATDGIRLGVGHKVPSGVIEAIISMDVMWLTDGSYRFKSLDAGSSNEVDILEDRATHTHYLGYIVCEEGTECYFTQGATVSGAGSITGKVCYIEYVKRR